MKSYRCVIEGCTRTYGRPRRGMCPMHYGRWLYRGTPGGAAPLSAWVNPLVCVCAEPVADLARDFGMCQICKRKPLALMAAAS